MFYTLSNLQDSIARRIQELGPDAPVAAFIFTEEDVYDCDGVPERNDEHYQTVQRLDEFLNDVMSDVGDSEYLYEQINDVLEDAVKEHLKKSQKV